MTRKKTFIVILLSVIIGFVLLFLAMFGFEKADVYPAGNQNLMIRKLKNPNTILNFIKPSPESFLKHNDLIIHKNPVIFDPKFKDKPNLYNRVVGMPGDIVRITDTQVFVNDKAFKTDAAEYFLFRISTENPEDFDKMLEPYDVEIIEVLNEKRACNIICSQNIADKIAAESKIVNIRKIYYSANTNNKGIFPSNMFFSWNKDNFGPVVIPQKGITVMLNYRNIALYKNIIDIYEEHHLIFNLNEILIDNKLATEYTFKNNYYFVLNDNRYSGRDSRQLGFVPEDYIVGKVLN
jgi:signal peptidase I